VLFRVGLRTRPERRDSGLELPASGSVELSVELSFNDNMLRILDGSES